MAINREKYDGVHFQVVLMNMRDGSVQGHAAGCADLKRGKAKFAEPSQASEVWDVTDKADGWLTYNSDFLAEGGEDNGYEIEWLPCANHIPAGDTHAAYVAAFEDTEPEQADEFANMTPEQREQALKNFTDLAENAPSESARAFWQGWADSIR